VLLDPASGSAFASHFLSNPGSRTLPPQTPASHPRYYDANGLIPSEYEMYDLDSDPTEIKNLAWKYANRTSEQVCRTGR
jgi:hypothetical protein